MNWLIYNSEVGEWVEFLIPPEGAYGFIYEIDNNTKDKWYVGKKAFHTPKGKQTNWKSYTGSNKELNNDIANGDEITKYVLGLYSSKTDLAYAEIVQLVKCNAIQDPRFYNDRLAQGIRGAHLKDTFNRLDGLNPVPQEASVIPEVMPQDGLPEVGLSKVIPNE